MNIALFYDTETNGLPDFKAPSEAPHQPHIVQLGARLVDLTTRQIISTLDVVIRPVGWTIPDEVSAIHGITTERAHLFGVSESQALGLFLDMWNRSTVRIGHNEPFDARIIRIAQHRFDEASINAWKGAPSECTQILATPILKLPPTEKMLKAGFNRNKSANLSEAYQFFTGKKLENAHSALADVDACMAVYFAVQDGQRQAA
ncbi:3'-5' exonuclease [Paucibacter sp. KBW04]|uniref:3'-5' exonuclease n=1 Tax=Paucibacter sp. KBW04 TaxID=2153361 RepID=UPI000F582B57|nr:3'-5' exonuclease [Paucibacter sp. KBW04]RQO58003.1 3'-5' exonuclease [Paucibacter sp. KBW04]